MKTSLTTISRALTLVAWVALPCLASAQAQAPNSPAVDAAKLLAAEGIAARVVSFPSWKIFEEQTSEYKARVLPAGVPKIAVEAGATLGWWKYVGQDGDVVGIDHFGASAPGPKVMSEFGFTGENVAARAKLRLKK